MVLEKTLESLLDCKEMDCNQSILKEISLEYSLEGLMLKLKLQYFGHPIQRTDSLEKTLMLGKTEGGRRRGRQRMSWLDGITNAVDVSLSKVWGVDDGQGSLAWYSPWGCRESETTEQLNWTDSTFVSIFISILMSTTYLKPVFWWWLCCKGLFYQWWFVYFKQLRGVVCDSLEPSTV